MYKAILSFLLILFLHLNCFSQESWTLLTTQENGTISDAINFTYIEFLDVNNGWACGSKGLASGAIFKTIDGGTTWTEMLTTSLFDQFKDLCFCDNNIIWAGGYKSSTSACLLYKSEDGGITWNSVTLPENLGVKAIHFANQNNGWVILRQSGSSRIYHTSDGGANWTVQMDGTTSNGMTIRELYCWHFFDENNAIAAGTYGHIIYTNDGGATWNYRDAPVSTQLSGMHFIDNNNGWIVGGAGYVLKTTDGGVSWTNTDMNITQSLSDVYFIDENTGWVCGGVSNMNQGILYKTIDGGSTWSPETLPTSRDLNHFYFFDNSTGWVSGNYGTIYKLGGTTDYENNQALVTDYRLEQNYPNPFNPTSKIKYQIAEPGMVQLIVHDLLGKEIVKLVDEYKSAGAYEIEFNADNLSSGIYFYTLNSGNYYSSKKMLLIR